VSSYSQWRWRAGTGVVIAANALVLAACGGGGSSSATTTTSTVAPASTTTAAPATTTTVPNEYIVQKGDSLGKIAKKFGVTVADLVGLNGITNPDKIVEGQRLKIPPPPATTVPPATTAGAATTVKPAPSTTKG
jgi:LysM repeat protein